MSNRIDKLFKDSLGEHKVSPSAEAWEKIQSGLLKKNKIIIAWRMAAVLVLVGGLVGAWYLLGHNEISKPEQLTESNQLTIPEKNNKEKSTESTIENARPVIAQTTKETIRKKRNEDVVKEEIANDNTEDVATQNSEWEHSVQYPIATEQVIITQSVKPEKPIVIEFTLETISNTPATEVAKITEEENSGLMKILEVARDVKNGESDLGIIRDTKNQLFALDFKKDKIKRN